MASLRRAIPIVGHLRLGRLDDGTILQLQTLRDLYFRSEYDTSIPRIRASDTYGQPIIESHKRRPSESDSSQQMQPKDRGWANGTDLSSELSSSIYRDVREGLYGNEEHTESLYEYENLFDLDDDCFTPDKVRARCIVLGIAIEADFFCWEQTAVFHFSPLEGQAAEGLLRRAVAEARAAKYYKREDEGKIEGVRNLSRSVLQKTIAQDIRVYLIWLALFGKGEHRVQIRYRRGCVPKDEAKNSYHSHASYRAHEYPLGMGPEA
ncbi:hypothetical protein DTO217A2_4614 [Paecilomyces variotii]|nr:hypothetical protein DTO217A2_4614 [Paecilomyces variotii]